MKIGLAGVILSAVCCAWGQEPPATLHVESRLVVLDVVVIDKDGKPIAGLAKDDFKVFESGQPQAIRSFEGPEAHRLPAAIAAGAIHGMDDVQRLAPDAPVTDLVMDEMNTSFEDMAYSRTALKKYLMAQPETLLQPTALLAATDSSFEQVHDYTLSRAELLEAVAKRMPHYPAQRMRLGVSGEGKANAFAETLAALQQVAEASVGHRGRKNIVWVGNGFPTIDMRNESEADQELMKGVVARVVNLLRDAHATVYTIDPTAPGSGVTVFGSSASAAGPDDPLAETHNAKDPFDGTISFNTLAPQTGGRAFALNNALDQAISTSVAEGNLYYTLSYVPGNASDAKQIYRGISVKVDRPGLTAVTRGGYYPVVAPLPHVSEKLAKKMTGFELGNAAVSRMTYTGLALVAHPAQKGSGYVVQVGTPGISWGVAQDGTQVASLILVGVAIDAKGKVLAQAASEATAKVPSAIPVADIPFATLNAELALPKGTVRVRFIVQDKATGRMGSAELRP